MSATARPKRGPMPREELVVWLDYAMRLRRIHAASPGVFDLVKMKIQDAEFDLKYTLAGVVKREHPTNKRRS